MTKTAGLSRISVPSLVGMAVLGVALTIGCGPSSSNNISGGSGGQGQGTGMSSGGDNASSGGSGTGGGPIGSGGLGSDSISSGGSTGSGGLESSSGGSTGSGGLASSSGGSTGSGGLASSSGGSTGGGGQTRPGGSTGAAGKGAGGSNGAAGRGSPSGSGGAGPGGATGDMTSGTGVCDIFASGNTPCVAAHSTVRALYGAYNGNLYQVMRADQTTKDIGVLTAGGFANAATQDTFCAGSTCKISIIYDQSGKNNHLRQAPAGQRKATPDDLADAAALKLTMSGHTVYGVHLPPGYGYRNDQTTGVATGDQPETEYMVTSGTFFNGNCCWDYGNAETNNRDDGAGTMEAVYFGNYTHQGKGGGTGPWVMADMENGVFAGPSFAANPMVTPLTSAYVTALVVGRAGSFALRGGNAQMGALTTMYDGMRATGYNPMKKQGAIILGIGGDNTAGGQGNFYEGVLTSGAASEATTNAVQANIVAAGYGM